MNRQLNLAGVRRIVVVVIAIVGIVLLLSFAGQFFYFLESVQEQEVGIQFRNNRIHEIVGPGVYSDVGIFVSLETISSQAIPFTVRDEEIITQDKQRIGLVVSGDIFRPDLGQSPLIREQWAQYRGIYRDDLLASTRVQDLARQSMKVCVGDRTFDNNIIGTSRDELRNCIDEELNNLVADIGLRIENLVVPEVILSPAVQAALDAIVQSRLETEKAAQDELKAEAEAAAEQARQEGEIRVEQSRIQEQTRQQIFLAQLEQERLAAQLAVIEATQNNDLADLARQQAVLLATKENELLQAEENLRIAEILAEVALVQAQADTALQDALALIYAQNPEYVELLIVQANASALTDTDKIIFTPEGTIPTLVLPGPGIVPTVETGGQTTVPATADSP
ncbi:SPFH domain-containing protein [Candidatus Leptofilum sp.]|uniref:SPFH domain-containing protein n=1 Tax=Candidatus Leptofilum sp. TaxID=3241576 RepID=UPI003B5C577F